MLKTVDKNKVVDISKVRKKEMRNIFNQFLKLDIANGDAREDTIRAYKIHIEEFLNWSDRENVNPAALDKQDIKKYRQYLVDKGMKRATMALKLTVIRRFYQALIDNKVIAVNPAIGIKPPRKRVAVEEETKYLTVREAQRLLNSIPKDEKVKSLRDRAIIMLMMIEGLRTVEIFRANEEDIQKERALVRGKGKDSYIYPRVETLEVLDRYLRVKQREVNSLVDDKGTPLFIGIGNRAEGERLTRRGIRYIVDNYLEKTDLKRPGISCHALRHTCGTLLYQKTRDLKVVQEVLRHSDINTTARYSHIIEQREARYTEKIELDF